jgi:hypothetical protein
MLLDPSREQLFAEFPPGRCHPFDIERAVVVVPAKGVAKEVVAGQQLLDVPFGPVGLVPAFSIDGSWDRSILLVT